MNLGLRDAIFFGEALPKHISMLLRLDHVPKRIAFLHRLWHDGRTAIAFTKFMLSISGLKGESKVTLRNLIMSVLGRLWFVQRAVAWDMSGLGRR